jgi:hypothetical protein
MKKKIFSILLSHGWIRKKDRVSYFCNSPGRIMKHLLDFRVPELVKHAKRKYCFTGLSAMEVWSDYYYVQRDIKRSPYFIKILKTDLWYWKKFFSVNEIPVYENGGTNIGEFVILFPVEHIKSSEKDDLLVDPLSDTLKEAKKNQMYEHVYEYIRGKYGER